MNSQNQNDQAADIIQLTDISDPNIVDNTIITNTTGEKIIKLHYL
jgi:hypothetical protein